MARLSPTGRTENRVSLPSSSDSHRTPLPDLRPDLAEIARRLRDADVAGTLAPVREALAGTQSADASLWLSSRLGAAVEAYADRVAKAAESSSVPDDRDLAEDAPEEPAA